jgi:hypothetical protein
MGRDGDLEGLGVFVERLEYEHARYGRSWWEDEVVVHSFCSILRFTVIKYKDLVGSADAVDWRRRLCLTVIRLREELIGEFEGGRERGWIGEVIIFLENIREWLDKEGSYCVGGWDRRQLEEAVSFEDDGDDNEFL